MYQHHMQLTSAFQTPTGARVNLPTELSWNPLDPFAVAVTFDVDQARGDQRSWVVCRQLLLAGLTAEHWVGDGDVRATRITDEEVAVELDNDEREALLFLPAPELSRFLASTIATTPLGDEQMADEVLFGRVAVGE